MDCNPPGSFVHGILQARTLEWVPMPSSSGVSRPRDQTPVSCLLHWPTGSLPWAPPGKPLVKCILKTWELYINHTEDWKVGEEGRHWDLTCWCLLGFLFASYILLGAGGARISELPTRGNLRSPKNCLLFPTRKAWKVNLARQKGCPTPDKTRPPSCPSQPRPGEQPWFPPLHIYHELLPIQVVSEGGEQEASFHPWMVVKKKKKRNPSPHNVGRNHMGILDFHPHLPWDGVRGYSEEIWSFHYNSVSPPLCQWRITGEQ